MHSMLKVVERLSRAIGTPVAFRASRLIRNGDYASLVQLKVDPSDYARAESYALDAQVVALFRKLEGLPTGVDLEKQALNTFYSCERECAKTNQRLAQYQNWLDRGFHGDALDLKLYEHICRVRKIIGDVLGEIPLDLVPRLSGGSTFFDKGELITIPHKMSSRPSVTPDCWSVVSDLWKGTAWYRAHDFEPEMVPGNRFTSVPKDSSKNRGICVEPSLNVGYQLSLGTYIRDRLRTNADIDIKGTNGAVNAQIRHRALAREASVSGSLSTLDLSNASDTVSYMLVKLLLPRRWFELLSALRSPQTLVGNTWIKTQKFSSMGCGFTFELETLIFWALGKSVSTGLVTVYGDDIILPTVDSGDMIALLTLCGFTVNMSKSFYDPLNPFRESCGGDYFNGVPVRPVYLKVAPSSPGEWMVLANQVRLIGSKLRNVNSSMIESVWRSCINEIPTRFRVFGPSWAGDGVLHSDDRTNWRVRVHSCTDHMDYGYHELRVLETRQKKISLSDFSPSVQLASALLGVPSTGPVPRDGILGYRLAWRPTVM